MGPGVDPHLYKASESDVRRLAEADLILYSGLHLEGKMGDILVKMARSRPVVAVAEAIPPRASCCEPPEFAGQYDPHVWFDVGLWATTIDPVVGRCSRRWRRRTPRPSGPAATPTGPSCEALDAWIHERVATHPARPAGAGHRPRRLRLLRARLRRRGGGHPGDLDPRRGRAPGRRAGGRPGGRPARSRPSSSSRACRGAPSRRSWPPPATAGHDVTIGGQLYSDSLGAAGGPEGTYAGAVRYNVGHDRARALRSAAGPERADPPAEEESDAG